MKKDNAPSEQTGIWTKLFNALAEAMKIMFSVIIAIVVAGSKRHR